MTPYYESDTLARIMDNRYERVKLARLFYLEYLKLMNHYGLLDKDIRAQWKHYLREAEQEENEDQKNKPITQQMSQPNPFQDRDTKIAMLRRKKDLENHLDMIRDYKDEEMKRDYYMTLLNSSILRSLEQLRLLQQEMELLKYQQTLPKTSSGHQQQQQEDYRPPPLKVYHIPKGVFSTQLPTLVQPGGKQENEIVQEFAGASRIVSVGAQTVDQKIQERDRLKQQVFQPGYNLPTMTIEEFAEQEVADAMQRQQQDEERKTAKENEDESDEEVQERDRKNKAGMDNWKDENPAGSGNTKRISLSGRDKNKQEQEANNEDMSYEYRPSDTYLIKEMDYKKSLLIEEFKAADINKDNYLSEHELLTYLDKQCKGKPFDRNIVKVLFQKMDKNRDGQVSSQEFINCYVQGEIQLKERLNDIIKTMAARRRQIDEFKESLQEAKQTEKLNKYGIMENSVLNVHVLQAEDLRANESESGNFEPYVILAIENQKIETKPVYQNTTNPIWDELVSFDISTGQENLQVLVVNKDAFSTNDLIGKCEIPLEILKDQMKIDQWFDLENPNQDELKQSAQTGTIRLQLQWVYCKAKYFEQALKRVEDTLQQEQIQRNNIQEHLKQYRSPFKSLLDSEDQDIDSDVEQDQLEIEARQGDAQAKLQVEEKKLSKKVELFAHGFAKKFGYETVPWYALTQLVLGVYVSLTILSMFFRPDFFNLTICVVSIYMITDTEKIRKGTFRTLLITLFASFAYDVFWLVLSASSYSKDDTAEDGGIEKNIRKFSLTMSFLSMIFRVIVIFVFWKDSIDFQRIIKRRNQQKYTEHQ